MQVLDAIPRSGFSTRCCNLANANSIMHIAYKDIPNPMKLKIQARGLPIIFNYYSGLIQMLGLYLSFPPFLLGERISLG